MSIVLSGIQKIENDSYFFKTLKSLDSQCRSCAPITPLECLTRCRVYRLKNELRLLRKDFDNPDYIKELFNVLKNRMRLHILKVLFISRYPLSQLQLELKKAGYSHSQSAISKEILQPLTSLGLVCEWQSEYNLTLFGNRLTKLLECLSEFAPTLPYSSKCYEEIILQHLLSGSKTSESIESVILLKNVSRTIKRLRSALLINTSVEREYVFFFKTKRDPNKEALTVTERKIYDEIAYQGSSAGKLASQTRSSKRVIYRCIKHLKGKKLVFQRITPKSYALTDEGRKLAAVLYDLKQTVEDAWVSLQQITQDSAITTKDGVLLDNLFLR
jgi:DNA-binding HxlR family transcriptional regulator